MVSGVLHLRLMQPRSWYLSTSIIILCWKELSSSRFLLEVVLPQTAEVLFLFHDCVVALLPEDLVFLTLLVNFSCVALFKRHHLFLVEALPVPGSKAQLRFLQRAVSQGPRQLRQCRPA